MRHPTSIALLMSSSLLLIGLHGCKGTDDTDPAVVDPFANDGGFLSPPQCENRCSSDRHSVLDCNGNLLQSCADSEGCDTRTTACTDACASAAADRGSVGCEFYAVPPDNAVSSNSIDCFAAFIANTWNSPVTLSGDYNGKPLDISKIAFIPSGSGQATTYTPIADNQIPAGSIAIVFLSGNYCPAGTASAGLNQGSGTRLSYGDRLATDRPVAAYDIYPYGGESAAFTSATLLLPTASWDTNYVAISPFEVNVSPGVTHFVAAQDGTQITILPAKDILGGPGVSAATAGTPTTYNLDRGQMILFEQPNEYSLDGSAIQSNKPIGMWSSMTCVDIPSNVGTCDSAHQQIPPVKVLGSEYALVRYRNRIPGTAEETPPWRIMGLVDGTVLTWEPAVPDGAPTTLSKGQLAQFDGAGPYVVKSQDADHPIYVSAHMTGCHLLDTSTPLGCTGDPEFVNVVPAKEFQSSYIFFTDPTYPETNLVLVRAKGDDGVFHDVMLDCADGPLAGWMPVGSSGDYEYTRTDLVTGNFEPQGKCDNGRHEIKSDAPFGITIWGWDSAVSYAYPGGMSVKPINNVLVK
ncbi:MAG: IgGFc-binding protein [Polyangiaceae bacterium]|nr:IgGFc-binding protein [Polyangiaceae bacterium]